MHYKMIESNAYLMHYGVKGMKWGVRKEYVPKGGRRHRRPSSSVERKTPIKSTGEIADAFIEGAAESVSMYAAYAAVMLAAYGAKRVSDLHKQGWFSEKYTADDIKKTTTTKEQDLKVINPIPNVSDKVLQDLSNNQDLTRLSPKDQQAVAKALKDGWFTNCVYCTTAAEMRRRGYDVEAKNSPGRGHATSQSMKWWKGSKYENFLGESINDPKKADKFARDTLKKTKNSPLNHDQQIEHMSKVLGGQGIGAHGDLLVKSAFSGHSVEYSVEKGGVKVYDNQFKRKYDSIDEFFKVNSDFYPQQSTFVRLDTCEPDIDAMLKDHVIKPRG